MFEIHVPESVVRQRLDKVLSELCEELSRSRLKILIEENCVCSEESILQDPSLKITGPMNIVITVPEAAQPTPQPENIPLKIVFEDQDIIVIDKQSSLVVHPAVGHATGTLVNALLYHCGDSLSGIGGVKRPGIVHRLDKETSGLMVVAKNDQAHAKLCEQFATRTLSRKYIAFVWGHCPPQGTVESFMARSKTDRKKMALYHTAGKEAITHFTRIDAFGTIASKVVCSLETGRTHQIRLQLSSLGHGVINDSLYGAPKRGLNPQVREEIKSFSVSRDRHALHAFALQLVHPSTGELMEFTSDMPADLVELEAILQKLSCV